MAWDSTNCQLAIAPNSWSKGNGTSNQNTGNFPTFPNGDFQNAVLTNMAAGYGYVYNGGDGYLNLDGNNDYLALGGIPSCLDASSAFTMEFWWWQNTVDVRNIYSGVYKDANNHIYVETDTAGNGIMRMNLATGSAKDAGWNYVDAGYVAGTWMYQAWVFDGGGATDVDKIKLYVGSPNIAFGQKTFDSLTGSWPATTFDITGETILFPGYSVISLDGKIGWCALYNEAITEARAAANYALGRDMGLIGTNTAGVMALASPSVGQLIQHSGMDGLGNYQFNNKMNGGFNA